MTRWPCCGASPLEQNNAEICSSQSQRIQQKPLWCFCRGNWGFCVKLTEENVPSCLAVFRAASFQTRTEKWLRDVHEYKSLHNSFYFFRECLSKSRSWSFRPDPISSAEPPHVYTEQLYPSITCACWCRRCLLHRMKWSVKLRNRNLSAAPSSISGSSFPDNAELNIQMFHTCLQEPPMCEITTKKF